MERVIRMADYLGARKSRRARAPSCGDGQRYFCTRCSAETFQLAASGEILCTHCGALMRNIHVRRSALEAT